MDLTKHKDIFVLAEQRNGKIQDVSFELIGEARRLTEHIPGFKVVAVLLGFNISNRAQELVEYGAEKVIVCDNLLLEAYSTLGYTNVLEEIIKEFNPDSFLIPATVLGRDLAPRIAARCNTGLTADATSLAVEEGSSLLLVTRPAFGGNLFGTIVCENHRPQMASIRPNVFEPLMRDNTLKGEIIVYNVNLKREDIKVKVIASIDKVITGIDLTKADIIISFGRGVAKHKDMIYDIAKELKAGVGCSRAVVDEGYGTKEMQIGQTGSTVRPKLYIACGISGAVQHVAGMEKSGYIIAINKDKEAPIFNIANLGIVGDAIEILPILRDELKKAVKNH